MMKWTGDFKPSKGVLFEILALLLILSLAGCGESPVTDGGIRQDVQVTAIFKAAPLAATATTVSLTVSDEKGNILSGESQNLELSGSAASGIVMLEVGEYVFDIKVFDKDDYLIGWGQEKVTVSGSRSTSISITLVPLPPRAYDVTVQVTWNTGGDQCWSIPALFFDGAAYVYADAGPETLNSFFPSGWIGDTTTIRYTDASTANPYSGETCARITYTATGNQGWAGMYWLPVPKVRDDWRNIIFGVDLGSSIRRLRWYARGERGGEKVEFFTGGVTNSFCPDSLPEKLTSPETVTLTKDWQRFEISLSSASSRELDHVVGGFGWAANEDNNPTGITFYIDEVKFVK